MKHAALLVVVASCTQPASGSPAPARATPSAEVASDVADMPASPATLPASAPAAPPAIRCPAAEDAVVVDTDRHALALCQHGQRLGEFAVSLGRGGVGKTREGDARTPLGRYPLAAPRRSTTGFETFIPVGYPTAAQRRAGFTGGAVGVHGPPEHRPDFAPHVTASDWTLGCIALASLDLARVVDWVRARDVDTIILQGAAT